MFVEGCSLCQVFNDKRLTENRERGRRDDQGNKEITEMKNRKGKGKALPNKKSKKRAKVAEIERDGNEEETIEISDEDDDAPAKVVQVDPRRSSRKRTIIASSYVEDEDDDEDAGGADDEAGGA